MTVSEGSALVNYCTWNMVEDTTNPLALKKRYNVQDCNDPSCNWSSKRPRQLTMVDYPSRTNYVYLCGK